jgi:LAO/AO transport system kinase
MVLLLAPGAGDALQGMKRGLTELADLVVINKSDGDLEAAAARAASDYRSSLRLLGTRKNLDWKCPVLRISTQTGFGLDGLIRELDRHRASLGDLEKSRGKKEWDQLWLLISRRVTSYYRNDSQVQSKLKHWKKQVYSGETTIDEVVDSILRIKD